MNKLNTDLTGNFKPKTENLRMPKLK